MMVKKITAVDDIIDFVFIMNSKPETSCKMIPSERELLKEFIEKVITHENDFIIAVYDKKALKGVFFLFYEPKDKYLELIGGYAEETAVCREFFGFMMKNYSGHAFDMIINPLNNTFIESARLEGAEFDGEQVEMVLTDFCIESVSGNAIPFSDKYAEEYIAIHDDEEAYWTAKKIINAKDIFRSYIALDKEKPIGYIDVAYNNPKNEIYNLFVLSEYRGLGYESALLQKAISDSKENEMIFLVNVDDEYMTNLCISLGFNEGAHTIYVKIEL